jgi:transketolase
MRNSQRKAYGEAIVNLGQKDEKIVVLDADLSKSTMSTLFEQEHPERFIEMGIAEQNMLSTAAGLAAGGKIPYVSTFAVFVTGRAFDQIRQAIAIGKLNVKICGSSAGLSDHGDGATHQTVEDIALMTALPNMVVLTPADAAETQQCVQVAREIDGPVYIRVSRNDVLDVINPEEPFQLGKLRVLKEGKDVLIFAYGVMVEKALDAAKELEAKGISAQVVSTATLKPFPFEDVAAMAKDFKGVVTVDEHNYIGGLASLVGLALKQSVVPFDYVAIDDTYGQSAHCAEDLYQHYGLTAENIVSKAMNVLDK